MAAIFYCVVIALVVRRRPELGPAAAARAAGPAAARRRRRLAGDRSSRWSCVGGIYGGIFTPTEGAAVGVIAMLVVAVLVRGTAAGPA